MVWELDRAGRFLAHLIELLKDLKEHGIGFISLTEQIDTTTKGGKPIFYLMGALAEFECDLTRERTKAGLAAARARGRVDGRQCNFPRSPDHELRPRSSIHKLSSHFAYSGIVTEASEFHSLCC